MKVELEGFADGLDVEYVYEGEREKGPEVYAQVLAQVIGETEVPLAETGRQSSHVMKPVHVYVHTHT